MISGVLSGLPSLFVWVFIVVHFCLPRKSSHSLIHYLDLHTIARRKSMRPLPSSLFAQTHMQLTPNADADWAHGSYLASKLNDP